jgi:hypothetical protein
MNRLFGILFILTGIFAIVGGLYTWGDGILFEQSEFTNVLIPWADILLTCPLSLLCGTGILRKKYWGQVLGLCTSGVYIFGSVLVFILIYWKNTFSIFLLIPSISGLLIGVGYIVFVLIAQKRSI